MGGTLFCDHASGKIFVRHQVSLGASDTIASKRSVEREAMSHGIIIKTFAAEDTIVCAVFLDDNAVRHCLRGIS